MQLGFGYWASKTLLSAVELGLFTELGGGSLDAEAIGKRLKLHPRGLHDFLDALVALGMLKKSGGHYANTPETAHFLDRNKASYVGGFLQMSSVRLYSFWGNLTEAQRTFHRYAFPRTDLTVTLDGVTIRPALALGGWVAFKPAHGGVMAMGDLVLLDTEINAVMTKLIESGIEITAIHNHVLRANPPTFYMHIGGHGDPVKMATAIRDALGASKTPLAPPAAAAPPPAIDLDTAQIEQILGAKGQASGGVYQFGIPRRDPITEGGMQITPPGPRWPLGGG